jgi:hypothetical protein
MKMLIAGSAVILICAFANAQPDSSYTEPVGDYVDLSGTAIEIKIEPDRPRITLFKKRIEPEFGTVDLDKSFMPELLGKGERIELVEDSERQNPATVEAIDIKSALNKPRKQ